MRPLLLLSLATAVLLLLGGCYSADQAINRDSDRSVLTQEDFGTASYRTAYAAVESLRPRWLRSRGQGSFRGSSQVQVYVDDSRVGGVEQLRYIAISAVESMRYIDANAATARWGLDHEDGAIYVLSIR